MSFLGSIFPDNTVFSNMGVVLVFTNPVVIVMLRIQRSFASVGFFIPGLCISFNSIFPHLRHIQALSSLLFWRPEALAGFSFAPKFP